MRQRFLILVLGIALGLAARGVRWAYDAAGAARQAEKNASAVETPAETRRE